MNNISYIALITGFISMIASLCFYFYTKNKESTIVNQEKPMFIETSTMYNEAPVKWLIHYQYLQHPKIDNFINVLNNKTIYLLETHQQTQRLIKSVCIEQKYNLIVFSNIDEMANFYNKELMKPEMEACLPNLILASDMAQGQKLLKIYRDTPVLQSAKFVMISQNPIIHENTIGTLHKPIKHYKLTNLLQKLT